MTKTEYFTYWKVSEGIRLQYQSYGSLYTAMTVGADDLKSLKILMEKLGPVTPKNRQYMARFLDRLYRSPVEKRTKLIEAKTRAS